MNTDLVCIGCLRPLAEAREEHPRIIRCACGIAYSHELIEQADPIEWQRILERDGYLVDETVTMGGERSLLITKVGW